MAEGSLLSSGETIPADPMDLFPRIEGEGWDSAHVGPSKKTNSSGSSWETPEEIRAPAELRDPSGKKGPRFKE